LLIAVAQALNISFQVPAVAIIQSYIPAPQRGVATALFMLVIGLTALGIGPPFVGFVSDLARPRFGAESLRIALAAVIPVFLFSCGLYIMADAAIREALKAADSKLQSTSPKLRAVVGRGQYPGGPLPAEARDGDR
jgi:MFS family permease